MAKIDVYTDDMASLSARLKNISSHIADAQKTAANVRRGLDFRVAAKLGIQNNITSAENKLKKQSARVLDLSKAAAVSADEFKNADGQIDKKARNILGKITAVLVSTKDSVKKFFTSLAISRHKAINDIFLTTGAVAAGAGGVGVLAALKRIAGKQDKTLDDAASVSSAGINGAIGGAVVSGIVGERINNGGRHDEAKPKASGKAATGNTADTERGAAAKAPTVAPRKEKKPNEKEKDQKELSIINKRYQTLPGVAKGFTNKCGAFVFQQLLVQGIVTKNATNESTLCGKDYARVLAKKKKTSTGYPITNYGKGDNAFDNFLEATKGKSPLTNIVCSFTKGSTTSNAKYGHTMLISKIENGKVYYIDNRKECRQADGSYKARCITIKEFKKIYFKPGNNCTGITGFG